MGEAPPGCHSEGVACSVGMGDLSQGECSRGCGVPVEETHSGSQLVTPPWGPKLMGAAGGSGF